MIFVRENNYPQYNIRLNLNNPYHLRLHEHLKRDKGEMFKSRNEYLVRKLYEGIFGTMEGIPKDDIKELEARLEKKITKELLKTVLGIVGNAGGVLVPLAEDTYSDTEVQEETIDKIDEEVANAALGYFDDWSEEDDE